MSLMSNSPLMYDDISSIMRCSASVKLSASVVYVSVTFFWRPSSIVFSYWILHSNQIAVLDLIVAIYIYTFCYFSRFSPQSYNFISKSPNKNAIQVYPPYNSVRYQALYREKLGKAKW